MFWPRFHQRSLFGGALLALSFAASPSAAAPSFTAFESGQVRPLALSPDGKLLFAVNTPDNRLEIFQVKNNGLTRRGSVPVGLEPVAVAARSNNEVWVVNHLSDSVSVVLLEAEGRKGRVARTLLVGDEPRDIVFAGPDASRAFITAAHRGQNLPFDPQITTPGVGRADVWVFDAARLGDALGGSPLTILTLFTDTPRALAVSPDGARVYAAGFHTGNRTTTINEQAVPDGGEAMGGLPEPTMNFEGIPQPEAGLIVKFDGAHWRDELGRPWDTKVKFSLPDRDVFAIDAMSDPPVPVDGPGGSFSGVGTILFNMAVNPVSGKVYVSNTEALNERRFEGPGLFAGHSVRGHLHESRITVLGPAGVSPRHLNKHIDYGTCCAPTPNPESEKSLAFPQELAVTRDGATLYAAALGSSRIGVYSTAALEDDTFVPSVANQILVSGGGPSGVVLSADDKRLYALTRFDDGISVIDTKRRVETAHVTMHNPEPPSITAGRRFLYDARFSSAHGDSACASCHVFGDVDSLAWDLGNPDASLLDDPNAFFGPTFFEPVFHPMKGPMATQSLRGMQNHGPMHWRGDRTGAFDAPSAQPDSGSFDEAAAFEKFQVAFSDLLGRSGPIPEAAMRAFGDFMLQVTYPPNPIRALDNSLTPEQQAGRDFFFGPISNSFASCGDCHVVNPLGNPGSAMPGFFGSDGSSSFDFEAQHFKIPHLRSQYQKVGMFGMPLVPFIVAEDNEFQGDQVRGFGFSHDGSVDTVYRFNGFSSFAAASNNPGGIPATAEGDVIRRQLEAYQLAFESNLAPIVGQQVTLTATNGAVVGPRLALFMERAAAGECDLVVKGRYENADRGYLYVGAGQFSVDRRRAPPLGEAALRARASARGQELTYTCAPPGSGLRIALDRDGDGAFDGDEIDAGFDPESAESAPRR